LAVVSVQHQWKKERASFEEANLMEPVLCWPSLPALSAICLSEAYRVLLEHSLGHSLVLKLLSWPIASQVVLLVI